jgi:hypothetical protein
MNSLNYSKIGASFASTSSMIASGTVSNFLPPSSNELSTGGLVSKPFALFPAATGLRIILSEELVEGVAGALMFSLLSPIYCEIGKPEKVASLHEGPSLSYRPNNFRALCPHGANISRCHPGSDTLQ